MEERDRGGHDPKNNRSVIKDKENLTEITLIFFNIFVNIFFNIFVNIFINIFVNIFANIFVNIFKLLPFPPPLLKPLDPEDNLQSIHRLSPYFTSPLRLMRDFEVLTAVLLRFLLF
jgi:hypothetical protein